MLILTYLVQTLFRARGHRTRAPVHVCSTWCLLYVMSEASRRTVKRWRRWRWWAFSRAQHHPRSPNRRRCGWLDLLRCCTVDDERCRQKINMLHDIAWSRMGLPGDDIRSIIFSFIFNRRLVRFTSMSDWDLKKGKRWKKFCSRTTREIKKVLMVWLINESKVSETIMFIPAEQKLQIETGSQKLPACLLHLKKKLVSSWSSRSSNSTG